MGTETLCQYRYQIKTYTSALCGEHIKEQVRPCRCAARHSWSFRHNAKGKASESSAVVHSKTFKFSDLMDKNGVYNTLKSHVTSMKMEMQTVPSPFDAALLPINTSGEKMFFFGLQHARLYVPKTLWFILVLFFSRSIHSLNLILLYLFRCLKCESNWEFGLQLKIT